MSNILSAFVEQLPLTDADRASLRKKRGFHDGTINKLKFRSCGLHVRDIINGMGSFAQLRKYQIVDENDRINSQLLHNNILIPYLGIDGSVIKIRPHKLGFKGDPIRPYCEFLIQENEHLIITEGEFKAAAAHQYGLSCIAVPGIMSYSNNHFEDLLAFIDNANCKRVTILFDREIKDDPEFSNYKKDWKSRYDTEIYSYIMAKKLERQYDARICRLPEEWMEDGKIDIDGALAQGISKDKLCTEIDRALKPDGYMKQLKQEHEPKIFNYINKRSSRATDSVRIRRKNNRYEWIKEENDSVTITNFVIDIVATYIDSTTGEKKREIVITNEYEERTSPMILGPDEMSSKSNFVRFCYAQGNYIFNGNEAQLQQIWQWEFMSDEGKIIIDLDHVGRVTIERFKNMDIWVTRDHCFFGKEVIEADDNGVFWIEDVGLKLKSLDGGEVSVANIPRLMPESDINLKMIKDNMTGMMGEKAKLLLGWAAYTLLQPYLKDNEISPIPFLYGEKASGKTTACSAIMGLFGMPDYGSTLTDITTVAITRIMSYYSNLPVWLDEFDNSHKTMAKESHLKAVYNKVPVLKGQRKQFGVAAYKIRSNLMLSGETIPTSDGLKTRSALLHMRLGKNTLPYLKWIDLNKTKLSLFMYEVLKRRVELAEDAEIYIEKYIKGVTEHFSKMDVRTARHYSIFAGCYRALFGNDKVFNQWLQKSIGKQRTIIEKDEVSQFFEDLNTLQAEKRLSDDFVGYADEDGVSCIVIWYTGAYDIWKDRFARVKEIHAKEVVRETIFNRPYFLKEARRQVNGKRRRVMMFNYHDSPDTLKDLVFNSISEVEKASLEKIVNSVDDD